MNPLELIIDNKKYEYIKLISLNNRNYLAYSDNSNIYIGECIVTNGELSIKEINDQTILLVKKEMGL